MADVTGAPVPTGASEFDVPGDMKDLADHFGASPSVANAAALPSSGNWNGRILQALDTGFVYIWRTSAWQPLAGLARTWQTRKGSAQSGITTSTFTNVLSLSLPSDAPAGRYKIDALCASYADAVATHYKSVRIGGTSSVSTGTPLDGVGDGVSGWPSGVDLMIAPFWFITHTGGALDIWMDMQISAGTNRIAGAACRLAVQFIGPT